MTHRNPLLAPILVLLAASLACGLPVGSGALPPTGAKTASPDPGPTALASAAPEDADPLALEGPPPPPAGFVDSIQEGVAEGMWTYEEGLIAALRVLGGESDVDLAFGDSAPENAEATGVLLDARAYLNGAPESDSKAEIERLYNLIVPDIDRLLPFSRPESAASSRPPGLASTSADSEACAKLYAEGFPPGGKLTCFVLMTTPIGNHQSRVFYPESWGLSDPRLAYAHASGQAIVDSFSVFSGYGVMKDVDLVFTLLKYSGKESVAALVDSLGGQDVCKIVVFPLALTGSEPKFKQVIAHEMFHCFQQWNLPNHFPVSDTDGSWTVQDWWGESTADYFSNVVYPTVNLEWNTLGGFAIRSAETSLVYMSYANSVFFQFLANQGAPTDVINLVKQYLPTSGTEADQAAALANYPGIANLFHQFGRDYVDIKIADTAPGSIVPTGYLPVSPGFKMAVGPGDHNVAVLHAPAFTLTRYSLRFVKERVYGVTAEEGGSTGQHASRLVVGTGWEPLPPTVSTGCGDVPYYVLLTSSAAGAAEPYTLSVTADVLQKTKCDPCLFGTWELNKDSFIGYMSVPFTQTPDFFDPGPAQGRWRYSFDKTGTLAAEFDFAFSYTLHQGSETLPIDAEVILTFKGPGQAMYWIQEDGSLMMQAVQNGVVMEQRVTINGQDTGGGPLDLFSPFPAQGATSPSTYSCSPSKLFLTPQAAAKADLPALEYDRVAAP